MKKILLLLKLPSLVWCFPGKPKLDCLTNASFPGTSWRLAATTNHDNQPFSIFKHGSIPCSEFNFNGNIRNSLKIGFYCRHDGIYLLRVVLETFAFSEENLEFFESDWSMSKTESNYKKMKHNMNSRIKKFKIIGSDCTTYFIIVSVDEPKQHVWILERQYRMDMKLQKPIETYGFADNELETVQVYPKYDELNDFKSLSFFRVNQYKNADIGSSSCKFLYMEYYIKEYEPEIEIIETFEEENSMAMKLFLYFVIAGVPIVMAFSF